MTTQTGLAQAVARVIRGMLAERRMTTKDFAAQLPFPKSNVYRYLSGEVPMNSDHIDAMATALGLDVIDLMQRAKVARDEMEREAAARQHAEAEAILGPDGMAAVEQARKAITGDDGPKTRRKRA